MSEVSLYGDTAADGVGSSICRAATRAAAGGGVGAAGVCTSARAGTRGVLLFAALDGGGARLVKMSKMTAVRHRVS